MGLPNFSLMPSGQPVPTAPTLESTTARRSPANFHTLFLCHSLRVALILMSLFGYAGYATVMCLCLCAKVGKLGELRDLWK
jgi:hypothetical protein